MVDSRALVPLAASSSTVLTVLSREVTLVTMTLAESFSADIDGSLDGLPAAFLVQPISSDRAEATSFTEFINKTYNVTQLGVTSRSLFVFTMFKKICFSFSIAQFATRW